MDLRIGGAYRIGNRLPDGQGIWIRGRFLKIFPPETLVYTWILGEDEGEGEDGAGDAPQAREGRTGQEKVTVRFKAAGASTEVIVVHEHLASEAVRAGHLKGWEGCLDGLIAAMEGE